MSIFDKIGSGVSEAGTNISQKAKGFSEQTRISGEITKRENRKKECFTVLGEMYYTSVSGGSAADFSAQIAEIRALDGELDALRLELREIKGISLCSNCGMEVSSTSAFCPNCGKELKKQNVCANCGAPMDAEAKFCVKCGAGVDS